MVTKFLFANSYFVSMILSTLVRWNRSSRRRFRARTVMLPQRSPTGREDMRELGLSSPTIWATRWTLMGFLPRSSKACSGSSKQADRGFIILCEETIEPRHNTTADRGWSSRCSTQGGKKTGPKPAYSSSIVRECLKTKKALPDLRRCQREAIEQERERRRSSQPFDHVRAHVDAG